MSRSRRVHVVALVIGSFSSEVSIYVHSECLALLRCVDHALVLRFMEISSHPLYCFTMFLRWIRRKSCVLMCSIRYVWPDTFVEVTQFTNYGSVIKTFIGFLLFLIFVKYAQLHHWSCLSFHILFLEIQVI